MQQGHNIENSIIPATFTALTVKFYALQLLSALLSRCSFFPAANKRPVRTNISIVQKTCVFRPVDISVAALKHNKLIYQSVYSLLGTELPQSKPIGFASSLWEGAFGMVGRFAAKVQRCLRSHPFRHRLRRCHLPQGDGFWWRREGFRHSAKASPWGSCQARQGLTEGVTLPQTRKKAAAPGAVQRLIYILKFSQFFFAA